MAGQLQKDNELRPQLVAFYTLFAIALCAVKALWFSNDVNTAALSRPEFYVTLFRKDFYAALYRPEFYIFAAQWITCAYLADIIVPYTARPLYNVWTSFASLPSIKPGAGTLMAPIDFALKVLIVLIFILSAPYHLIFNRAPLKNYRDTRPRLKRPPTIWESVKKWRAQRRADSLERQKQESALHRPAEFEITTGDVANRAHLKLKRTMRSTTFSNTVIFALDARMDLPREDQRLVVKYKLGGAVVYDSQERQRYNENAKAHLEGTRDQPGYSAPASTQAFGAVKSLYKLGRASYSAALAKLALRVTVQSLMAGVHVECKSMPDLLEAESAIITAAQNLKSYLDTALTFDGRETLIEL